MVLITAGTSMLATILTSPPHLSQVSTSRLKTRFNRFAQVIEARFSAGVWSTSLAGWRFLSLPRPAGVTFERYLLLGANTPWKRVYAHIGTMRSIFGGPLSLAEPAEFQLRIVRALPGSPAADLWL